MQTRHFSGSGTTRNRAEHLPYAWPKETLLIPCWIPRGSPKLRVTYTNLPINHAAAKSPLVQSDTSHDAFFWFRIGSSSGGIKRNDDLLSVGLSCGQPFRQTQDQTRNRHQDRRRKNITSRARVVMGVSTNTRVACASPPASGHHPQSAGIRVGRSVRTTSTIRSVYGNFLSSASALE